MTAVPQSSAPKAAGQARKPRYETRDVSPRAVLYAGLGLFASILLSGALVAGILKLMSGEQRQPPVTALEAHPISPPEPGLEISPPADRVRLETQAERRLQGHGWVDKAAGRARIPIEEAMRIVARQGWQDPGKPPP